MAILRLLTNFWQAKIVVVIHVLHRTTCLRLLRQVSSLRHRDKTFGQSHHRLAGLALLGKRLVFLSLVGLQLHQYLHFKRVVHHFAVPLNLFARQLNNFFPRDEASLLNGTKFFFAEG